MSDLDRLKEFHIKFGHDGWDSYRARAIQKTAVDLAVKIYEMTPYKPVKVSPSVVGAVLFKWNNEFYVEIYNDGTILSATISTTKEIQVDQETLVSVYNRIESNHYESIQR